MLFIIFYFTLIFNFINANKFCINCKFYIKPKYGFNINNSQCSAFYTLYNEKFKYDYNIEFLVTGNNVIKKNNKFKKILGDYQYCYIARKFENLCGINAKAYKEKETYKEDESDIF